MRVQTKKIIAREFLVTIGCILVSLLYLIGTVIYNYTLESQKSNISSELRNRTNLKDSLLESYEWLYSEANNKGVGEKLLKSIYESHKLSKKGTYEEFKADMNDKEIRARVTDKYLTSNVSGKWDSIWNKDFKDALLVIGFKDGESFNSYINKNMDNEDKQYYRIERLNEEIKTLNQESTTIEDKQIDYDERIESTLAILFILGIISFPIRYFYYAIIWSWRTLYQKE